jgi:MoxR-like ATPase
MSELQSKESSAEVREASAMLGKVREEISRAVVGQGNMIDGLLMGILANGHVLLEGVPGLAKTLAVKAIS